MQFLGAYQDLIRFITLLIFLVCGTFVYAENTIEINLGSVFEHRRSLNLDFFNKNSPHYKRIWRYILYTEKVEEILEARADIIVWAHPRHSSSCFCKTNTNPTRCGIYSNIGVSVKNKTTLVFSNLITLEKQFLKEFSAVIPECSTWTVGSLALEIRDVQGEIRQILNQYTFTKRGIEINGNAAQQFSSSNKSFDLKTSNHLYKGVWEKRWEEMDPEYKEIRRYLKRVD